jgi:hypothetical protein
MTAVGLADIVAEHQTPTPPKPAITVPPPTQEEIAAIKGRAQWLAMLAAAQVGATMPPPVTPTPPAPATSVVNLAPIRDTLVSIAATLIPGFIGLGLTWMRSHLKIMQDVGMNSAITDTAQRLGSQVVTELRANGQHINSIDIHSPMIASLANSLIGNYPEFAKRLNLTPDKAANIILGEATQVFNSAAPPPFSPAVATKLAALADTLNTMRNKPNEPS